MATTDCDTIFTDLKTSILEQSLPTFEEFCTRLMEGNSYWTCLKRTSPGRYPSFNTISKKEITIIKMSNNRFRLLSKCLEYQYKFKEEIEKIGPDALLEEEKKLLCEDDLSYQDMIQKVARMLFAKEINYR